MVHDVMKRKMSLFMNTFAGDASDELGFMYKFANDSEREIYSTKVDNFVARFAWMVLQHIVSFSNMVGSDSYLETAKKQEQKSQETKISKHQHEVKETRPVQQREETRPVQERDVYFEFRNDEISLRCWQKIEGLCPTDSLYLVVGDILQVSTQSREAGTSPSRENKFNLRIANFDFPVHLEHNLPIVFENYDNQVETETTNISELLEASYFEVIVDEKDPRYQHALKSLSGGVPQFGIDPKIKETKDGIVMKGYIKHFRLLKIRGDKSDTRARRK
jgi:hypothetical protein